MAFDGKASIINTHCSWKFLFLTAQKKAKMDFSILDVSNIAIFILLLQGQNINKSYFGYRYLPEILALEKLRQEDQKS